MILCIKCLEDAILGERYCPKCGAPLIEIVFRCGCGAELCPLFSPRFFPPWGQTLNRYRRHCPSCGKNVEKVITEKLKSFRK